MQIVKFLNVNEPAEEMARMYVIEDRGETLFVKDLHPYHTLPSSRVVMKDAVTDGIGFLGGIMMENIERNLAEKQIPIIQFFEDLPLDYSNITLQDLEVIGEYLDVPVSELLG